MNPILSSRMGLLTIIAAVPFVSPAHGGEVPDACSGSDPGTILTTEHVQLSHLQTYRDTLDFKGARIVGCAANTGDASLARFNLAYDMVMTRGGGGGTISVDLPMLEPGEQATFVTSEFNADAESLERRGIQGIELRGVERQQGMQFETLEFEQPLLMDYPLAPRPEHALEPQCAEVPEVSTEDTVELGPFDFVELQSGAVKLVGCVRNGLDEPQDDLLVRFSAHSDVDAEATGSNSGSGSLDFPAELEPGASGFFASGFDLDSSDRSVRLRPLRWVVGEDGIMRQEEFGEETIAVRKGDQG